MYVPRFRNFLDKTRLLSPPHRLAALALAFALVAGLACDENALTETRAPAEPTELAGSDAPDLAAGDITAMGTIPLPVNQSIATTAPAPAFRVSQTGSGPDGIFQISNTANTQPALQGLTNGRGRAGFFRITNTINSQAAILAQTNGSGFAVAGITTGTSPAGSFQITNTNNTQPALRAQTNGTGQAGLFQSTNFSAQNALEARSNSDNGVSALYAVQSGEGVGGTFEISNAGNLSSAIRGRTAAIEGGAAQFFATHPQYNGTLVSVNVHGPNFPIGLEVTNSSARGPAGRFFNFSTTTGNALVAETQGTGYALLAMGRPKAGLFQGSVHVEGTLTKTAGSFKIDHPLDPEHKTLSHSFVESPDMKNVYDGTAILDGRGEAVVMLPPYFEALNSDFRYQLTAIGAPAPNLHISQKIRNNRFVMAGGIPGTEVSWQVTGIRQDAYANEHRIKVEEDKPAGELVARH